MIENGMVVGRSRHLDRLRREADARAARFDNLRADFIATLRREPLALVETPAYSSSATSPAVDELFQHLSFAGRVVIAQLLTRRAAAGDTDAQMVIESTALAYAECHADAGE